MEKSRKAGNTLGIRYESSPNVPRHSLDLGKSNPGCATGDDPLPLVEEEGYSNLVLGLCTVHWLNPMNREGLQRNKSPAAPCSL